jgi:hypothetical protein
MMFFFSFEVFPSLFFLFFLFYLFIFHLFLFATMFGFLFDSGVGLKILVPSVLVCQDHDFKKLAILSLKKRGVLLGAPLFDS